MSGTVPATLAYIPGLDGLRALAVLAVLLYHAGLPAHGGFLGVESFLVISGFLITALLLADHQAHARVRLGAFWWRRARRLLPALFALLALVTLLTAVAAPRELAGLGVQVLAALAYVTNWQLIAAGQSYFDAVARPPLLQHLWSLAVEEQFYIFWPLAFAAGMRFLGPRRLLGLVVLGAAASAALMAALYDPGADPSRIYYGTDTRAVGLLVGVALAFVWAPGRRPALAHPRAGPALDAVGLLALGGLLYAYAALRSTHPALYTGGIAAVSLATAALVAAVTHPAARLLPRLLELAPLRWVGLRSYSLYLWHWPIFMITRPGIDVPASGLMLQLARFALAFACAAASYAWIERPIRQGALERAWAALGRLDGPAAARAAGRIAARRHFWAPVAAVVALSLGMSYVGASIAQAAVRQSRAVSGRQSLPAPAPRLSSPGPTLPASASPTAGAPAGVVPTAAPSAPAFATAPASGAIVATPEQDEPQFDAALAADLQAILDATVAEDYVPGAVVSVRRADGTTWTGTGGLADVEAGRPMEPDTRVRVGSLSKIFVAVTVLQLVEEGRLGLNEPVEGRLPGLLPDGERITVRHLLQHTSGLYDYFEDPAFIGEAYADPGRAWAPQTLIDYANGFGIRFAPGSRWDYSNTNYVVLGLLVEQVTGNSLAAELEQRLFAPLGLEGTYAGPSERSDASEARGYSRYTRHARTSLSFAFGTANIVSTAGDVRRFGEALFGGELLGPELTAEMRQFVSGRGQYEMPALEYGLGLMRNVLEVGPAPDGAERPVADSLVIGHIGGINGFRSALWYAPEHDLLLAVSVNQGAIDPNILAADVLDALLAAEGR